LVIKLLFVSTNPVGSDDYYRYLWDGKVQTNGTNPFQFAPNDSELTHLSSDILPAKVSYPNIKTIYFPVAQTVFSLSYWLSEESVVGLKIYLMAADLLILICLFFLFKQFKIDNKFALIYLTLPLIYFQFYIDAHIDLFGAALMLASLTLYFYNKKLLSYIILGLSISVKPTGLILIPFYFQNEVMLKKKLFAGAVPLIVFTITFLPYVFTATPLDTLILYSSKWTFNGMIYNAVNLFFDGTTSIRIACGILFLLAIFVIYILKIRLEAKIYLALFLLLIFSPIVHPWYLIWFAVLLPISRRVSGIYFVAAASLTFATVAQFQQTGIWNENPIVLIIEYLPLTAIFVYELWKNKFELQL
ncbi:MAG: hypothetical protein ABIJ40_17285, partial [Bacteroidota bacterium]|nr:hypothetical protein [Bacteroidota bacterium]